MLQCCSVETVMLGGYVPEVGAPALRSGTIVGGYVSPVAADDDSDEAFGSWMPVPIRGYHLRLPRPRPASPLRPDPPRLPYIDLARGSRERGGRVKRAGEGGGEGARGRVRGGGGDKSFFNEICSTNVVN